MKQINSFKFIHRMVRKSAYSTSELIINAEDSHNDVPDDDIEDDVVDTSPNSEPPMIDGVGIDISIINAELQTPNITEEFFGNDNKKVLCYTGLPTFYMLKSIFELLEPFIERNENDAMPKSQMFLLFLMKLRSGLQLADLGLKFGISKKTASSTFFAVLFVVYCKLRSFVVVPSRDAVKLTMPMDFKQSFSNNVSHIVDFIEILIHRPIAQQAFMQCWSEGVQHTTVKYLVSITPQGCIQFISDSYGGAATDDYLLTRSEFLKILQENDYVLAGKEFNIGNSQRIKALVFKQGQLKRRRKNYWKISNVEKHVDRLSGLLKRKFLIMQQIMPIQMVATNSNSEVGSCMDQIVLVCSALWNLCPIVIGNDDDV